MPKAKLKLGKGTAFVKSRLKALRQEDVTWEADFRALPKPMMQSETYYLGLAVTQVDGHLLADLSLERTPDANDLATLLAHAMRQPLDGSAHRPQRILLRKNPRWTELFPHLSEVGVVVVTQSDLPKVNDAYRAHLQRLRELRAASAVKPTTDEQAVETLFPSIAKWVGGYGHIEIGDQEGFGFVVRALDYGGVVFEDDKPTTLSEALAALEAGLARWFEEQESE